MFEITTKHPTVELTWGETATAQLRVHQKPSVTKSLFRPRVERLVSRVVIRRESGLLSHNSDEARSVFVEFQICRN